VINSVPTTPTPSNPPAPIPASAQSTPSAGAGGRRPRRLDDHDLRAVEGAAAFGVVADVRWTQVLRSVDRSGRINGLGGRGARREGGQGDECSGDVV
jgi:hypothetical protein